MRCECWDMLELIEDYNKKKEALDRQCYCHLNAPCWFCTTDLYQCKKCKTFLEVNN